MKGHLRSFSEFLFGRSKSRLAISQAGIHATVLSILIGFGITYVLHINTQIFEVETDAIKIAERVNDIKFSAIWLSLVSPGGKFLEYWSSTDDQMQEWLASYWLDPTGSRIDALLSRPPFKIYFSDIGLNHTEFKLCLMAALVLRYPFPERMVTKKGRFVGMQPTPAIVFSDIKAVEDWRLAVEKKKFYITVSQIDWFGADAFVQGFDWSKEINLFYKFWKNSPGYSSEKLKQFRVMPGEFCSNVESIYGISRALDYRLKRFHYLKRLSPSRPLVVLTLVFAIVTFFSGIVVPFAYPAVSRFLVIWVPTLFYTYFLVYLVIKVSSIVL
jgi:hypothetical protein